MVNKLTEAKESTSANKQGAMVTWLAQINCVHTQSVSSMAWLLKIIFTIKYKKSDKKWNTLQNEKHSLNAKITSSN